MLFLLFFATHASPIMETKIKELVKMLTVISWFSPRIKDIHYSIYVDYALAKSKHYCRMEDGKKALYWSQLASKYLLKRIDLLSKKRA